MSRSPQSLQPTGWSLTNHSVFLRRAPFAEERAKQRYVPQTDAPVSVQVPARTVARYGSWRIACMYAIVGTISRHVGKPRQLIVVKVHRPGVGQRLVIDRWRAGAQTCRGGAG